VPIFMPGFSFPEKLPAEIEGLQRHNGITYSHEFFEGTMTRLAHFMGEPLSKSDGGKPGGVEGERRTRWRRRVASAIVLGAVGIGITGWNRFHHHVPLPSATTRAT